MEKVLLLQWVTADHFSEMQMEIDGSISSMDKIMKIIRRVLGMKSVAPNASQDMVENGKKLDDFYTEATVEFEVKEKDSGTSNLNQGDKEKKSDRKGTSSENSEKGKGKKTDAEESKKKDTVKVKKSIVYVKDVSSLVEYVIKSRGLDPLRTIVRIGLDGGQNTFKVMK